MRNFFLILFCCLSFAASSQEDPQAMGEETSSEEDTIKPPIEDYKIITVKNDTSFVDTTLHIHKDYRFNYLRRDNFELLPFPNTGQTYQALSPRIDFKESLPKFGARARHYKFMEVEDINYYRVPTPLTELYFKTVPEQGQQLDAFLTMNISDRLNFSVAHTGVRALGQYRHILTSTGIFRFTLNYETLNKRYRAKSHFVTHDLMNQENGGLRPQALQQYISKEEEFEDRAVLDINFEDAESTLSGKRFYLDHSYSITNPATDSLNKLSVGHIFNFSYKKFQFLQSSSANSIFGESFETINLRDEVRLEEMYNQAHVDYANNILGSLRFKAGLTNYNYGYNTVYVQEEGRVNNRLIGAVFSAGGEYSKQIGGFQLNADASLNLGEDFSGNHLAATASYHLNEANRIEFGFNQSSRAPNYNYLLYQSDYINYNWQNDFDNIHTQNLHFALRSKKILDVKANLAQVQNYTFFGLDEENNVKPFQHDGQTRYLKIRAERGFDLGKFGVYNTLMYQNVLDGADVLKLPDFVTRNSVYYQDYWFQRALYLQTGFTFKYFTGYEMNGYDPVLAEFYVQDEVSLGGYPVVDFFFNTKIDQARIFFKLEHLNSLIHGNNNFVAPNYPYTDFLLRFGLVWNFFL